MSALLQVIVSTLLAGLAMSLGALLAKVERIGPNWLEQEFRHGVTAFGGGALLSAIALVLVPEGIAELSLWSACGWFLAGGLAFMALDIVLKKIHTPAAQLAAMLSDFIPESIALGAAFASGSDSALLLAALIALQNMPEGFSAYRELMANGDYRSEKILLSFVLMALLGPLAGISGYFWLADYPSVVAAIMLFASGGILYSLFQDIAPQVKLDNHWLPPLGAVLGFILGLAGFMLTHQ